jgi:hypothetical protein
MLRIVNINSSLPDSYIVDPSAEFLPGMVGQLAVIGNQVMMTVSNGLAPLGIIDDIKTRAFTANSWNEVIIVPATGVMGPQGLYTPVDIKAELANAYISANSFFSTVDVMLTATNGVITFPAGTLLNYDQLGTGQPNAIRTIVNYSYQIPNIPGDDSTIGSGRVTVWYMRGRFQTDQFETSQAYPVNANLYVSEYGLFTTRRPTSVSPAIAIVTAPPVPVNPMLELVWL